jgi:hypothetical protein
MANIIIGLLFIIGGLSGKVSLRGTDSSGALVVVGALLAGWGVFKMVRARGGGGAPPGPGAGT